MREVLVDDELAEYDRNSHWYVPVEELKAAGDPRWREIGRNVASLIPDGATLHSINVDPFDPTHLYVGLSAGGVGRGVYRLPAPGSQAEGRGGSARTVSGI